MDMTVHEARYDDPAADVRFFDAVVFAEPRDVPVADGDVFMLQLFGKDVQNAGALEDKVGFFTSHCDVDDSFEVHQTPPLHRTIY